MKYKIGFIVLMLIMVLLYQSPCIAQENGAIVQLDEGQKMMMPAMMQKNMKMMGDMMIEISKMMEKDQMTPEQKQSLINMMKNMGCMMQSMESGCTAAVLKINQETLETYKTDLEKMAEEF